MGDRVSISFVERGKNNSVEDESVAIFSHWGGMNFVREAERFVKDQGPCVSRSAREPCFMAVYFLEYLFKKFPDRFDPYLGKDPKNGDNSDNGHFWIDICGGFTTGGE